MCQDEFIVAIHNAQPGSTSPLGKSIDFILLHGFHNAVVELFLSFVRSVRFRILIKVLVVALRAVDAPNVAALELAQLGHVAELRCDGLALGFLHLTPRTLERLPLHEIHDNDDLSTFIVAVSVLNRGNRYRRVVADESHGFDLCHASVCFDHGVGIDPIQWGECQHFAFGKLLWGDSSRHD